MSNTNELGTPATYKRWHLYGAGMENVGKDGKPETVGLQHPGPDEILVRHDACGICYSDIKIINLGGNHPRLVGRDLAQNPVVMGHEVALTVVKVGENLRDTFHAGQRYIVQADVYYKGVNLAYGYAITGGMSEFGIIGPEVLQGDEGCYLLPLKPETGAVEAALVEPWACVEAAYHWWSNWYRIQEQLPVHWLMVGQGLRDEQPKFPAGDGFTLWDSRDDKPSQLTNESRFEIVAFIGDVSPDIFMQATQHLNKNGNAMLLPHTDKPLVVSVDVGRIHYDGHFYTGNMEGDGKVGLQANTREELKAGGTAWFIGAAGPMGQMHVQRALSLPHPPSRLVCTDRQAGRIAALVERFGAMAEERDVELLTFNIRTDGMPDLHALAPHGFDDIVVMVPSIEAIEEAFPYLGEGGVMNVFAGVARGTTANLDMSLVATRNVRIVGTSGSSIEDMRRVRDAMEAGRLDTGASLAAIGGLEAFRDGLEAVRDSKFPGKTVIFPHVHGLPLTPLSDLATIRPDIAAHLHNGQWTREAEAALLMEPNHENLHTNF